jgi:hypothetical protein
MQKLLPSACTATAAYISLHHKLTLMFSMSYKHLPDALRMKKSP